MEYKQNSEPNKLLGGSYGLYEKVFDLVEKYLTHLRAQKLIVPYPETLKMRAEYLRFQILMVSQIYGLSNQLPWIGGKVTTLTISSKGIEEYETRREITGEEPSDNLQV